MGRTNLSTKNLLTPAILTVALIFISVILLLLGPAWINPRVHEFLLAAISVSGSIVLVRTVNFLLFDILFRQRKGREAPQLLRMVVSIICYSSLFVLIYTLVFGKSLTGVLATSAVLSVILGLALQDTLGNFFAGISLHIEQPFHIGDTLCMADMIGRVESVTWRTTAIRTNNNSIIIMPNSRIAREPVEIHPLNGLNRRVLRFQGPYSIPPRKIIAVVRQAVHSVPRLAPEKEPVIRIAEFSDSAVTYELLYWVADYMWTPDMDAIIRERIWYSFGRNGIEIPFPVRHVLLEKREGHAGEEEADYQKLLASVDILKPLSSQERQEVARSLVRRAYAPGELAVRRGDAGDSMFLIHRGRVEILVPDASGQPQQVAVLGTGNFFGEMSLFTGEARTADVRALEELDLLVIQKPAVERLLIENDKLAQAFSVTIAERQARLAEISRAVPEEEKQRQSETILQRIQRFFSLK
jgi:small-conductance mechanosensitive channel/CRP-like cAMP-binding protein